MIRNLLASTALVTLTATAVLAQEQAAPNSPAATTNASERFLQDVGEGELASRLIGETVYASNADDADIVGEINDLVVSDDGDIDAVVVGVGGFLGVGEKNVAVPYDTLDLARDDQGDLMVIMTTSKEELEAAPTFEVAEVDADRGDPAATETAREVDREAAPAAEETREANEAVTRNDVEHSNLPLIERGTIKADAIADATVYSPDEENIGTISDVLLTTEGQIDAVVIDVGGFLGIGAKSVAIAFDALEFRQADDGEVYVYSKFSEEQLKAAATYVEDEYEQNRDAVLLR